MFINKPHGRRPLLTLLGVAVALALTASSALAAGGNVFIVGAEGAIPPMDPHRMSGTVGLRIIDAIFDTLVREELNKPTKAAPELKPALAESWSVSADGKTYTLRIRQGVIFHDGSVLDAAVVKANFDRGMDKSAPFHDDRAAGRLAFLTRWIESVSAPDANTFVIQLKHPFSALLRLLTDRRVSMVSMKALNQYKGDALGIHPVGTGPFILDEFKQGQPLHLRRNDNYWGNTPKIEGIVFRPILDATSMAIAMQTGEIDFIPSASSDQVAQLKNEPGIVVQYPDTANQRFLRLNTRIAPTSNVKFRQALNYAVNRKAIERLFSGDAAPAYGPVPRGNEAFGKNIAEVYSHDPQKAKELMAASGVSTPLTLKLLAPSSGPGNALATQVMALLQQDFKPLGITLDIQFLEFRTLISTERSGYKDDIHGSHNGWTTGADSAFWLERMFSGLQHPPKGVNRGWYKNEKVDALFDRARQTLDAAKRMDSYRQAAVIIADEAPWVFLYQDRLPRIFRDRVTGIVEAASVYIDYSSVGLR